MREEFYWITFLKGEFFPKGYVKKCIVDVLCYFTYAYEILIIEKILIFRFNNLQ